MSAFSDWWSPPGQRHRYASKNSSIEAWNASLDAALIQLEPLENEVFKNMDFGRARGLHEANAMLRDLKEPEWQWLFQHDLFRSATDQERRRLLEACRQAEADLKRVDLS